LVLNGPNLNLLGTRKPEIYGTTTIVDVEKLCRAVADGLGLGLDFKQSNHEGQLIDWIQEAGAAVKAGDSIGAVFNPGAFTHTSLALHDAIEAGELPLIEVHISNVHAREPFRHHSYISPIARGIIVGFGVQGYALAIEGLHRLTNGDPPRGERGR
jgi:3-dehydroquinate dehydratase-2